MHKERNHKWLVAVFVLLVIIVVAVIAAMVGIRYAEQSLVTQIQGAVKIYAEDLESELNRQGAQVRIYDSDEQLMSVLMPEGAGFILNPIWTDIAAKACGDVSTVILHEVQSSDAYNGASTVIPQALSGVLDYFINENEIGLSLVNEMVPKEIQVAHILSSAKFGDLGEGIVGASYELFATDPDSLSVEQFELLMRFLGSTSSVDDILEAEAQVAGMKLEDFKDHLNISSSSHSSAYGVNQLVKDLLDTITQEQGLTLSELGDLSVKTSINSGMQHEIQQLVDKMLATNVDLGSDGSLAEECSVVVVDPAKSNCILAYVPSRTGRDGSQREVMFKNAQMVADFATAERYISENKTSVSLVQWKDSKGVAQPIGLDSIVKNHLAELTTAEAQDVLSAYELFSNRELMIVIEVQDATGKVIYTAEPEAYQETLSAMIREELFTDDDGIMRMVADTGTGSVKFWRRSDFGVGIYSGAYAQGYTGSKADINEIASEVNKVVQTYYKPVTQSKVVASDVQAVMTSNKKENFTLVQKEMQEKFSTLQGITISTSKDVDAFEALYSSITERLSELKPYLNQGDLDTLVSQQASIRKQKSEELVSAAA